MDAIPLPTTPTITVEEAAVTLNIGRTLAYRLARSGELPGVRKLGNRYIVSIAALKRYLEEDAAQDHEPTQ